MAYSVPGLSTLIRSKLWWGIALTLLVIVLRFTHVDLYAHALERTNGLFYDLRLMASPVERDEMPTQVHIIDIDEKTMEAIGWPWPRTQLATLIDKLSQAGVLVMVFDVLFAEPEPNPAEQVAEVLRNRNQSDDNLNSLIPVMDGDQHFADGLARSEVVLGYLLQHDSAVQRGTLPEHNFVIDAPIDSSLKVPSYEGYVTNLPLLQQAAMGAGYINASPDQDGFLRRTSLVSRVGNRLYPSLALEAARLYALAEKIDVMTTSNVNSNSVTGLRIGNERIPTDASAQILIPYRGPARSFPYHSAIDILRAETLPESLFGSVVFVGTSAVGLADLRATPMGVQYPGVEVHANVLEGLLEPDILKYRPDWWEGALFLYLLVTGLVLSLLLPKLGPMRMTLTGAITIILTAAFNLWLWHSYNLALPMSSALLLVILITTLNTVWGFFTESRQRHQIKSVFNQYVPPAHIDTLLNNPEAATMDGERREMTVLFSDIRSFTNISEHLSANDLKQLLNRYFSPITECIFEHKGTIDKYVGDMVMAFWGAPLQDEHHAQHAVKAGLAMLEITESLQQPFADDGLPEVDIGIGLNTGDMNVGDMGSVYRRAYTVLGDAVNLGSRLEGLTKFYGVKMLISESTYEQCEDLTARLIDKVKVKGKSRAITIYEPLFFGEADKDTQIQLDKERAAYADYLNQSWSQAKTAYTELIQQYGRSVLYELFLERIATLSDGTLPHDWDGSFTHTQK